MVKAGIIVAAVVLFISICGALLSPLIVPCGALLAGGAAGYLASTFENPTLKNDAVKKGLTAGAIASAGAVLGQIIGAALNSMLLGPEGAQRLLAQMGYQTGSLSSSATTTAYWVGVVGSAVCLSAVNIVVATGLGALGGLLWWQIVGSTKQLASPPPTMPAQ